MADKYSNYADLAAAEEEGVDFEVVVMKRDPPRVAVIAPHAGGIEPRTGPIARKIVGAEFSLYCCSQRGRQVKISYARSFGDFLIIADQYPPCYCAVGGGRLKGRCEVNSPNPVRFALYICI